jgi:beta-CASP RNase J family ribonuclease
MTALPLSITPLGGLGKIGMNAMLVGHRDRLVLVDCGVGFAPVTMIGAERMLPDLDLLARLKDRIEAVVITHGHEDHIGALPWALPVLDPATPIFASPFTTELIRLRLQEHDLWKADRVQRFTPAARFTAGPFEAQAIRVTHSLPDCASIVLRCEDGNILHTGDWKIDDEPLDGQHFDRAAFSALAADGIDLMMSDSTNILAPGRTRSEADVVRELARDVEGHPGRVIITLFASNLHRLRGLAAVARTTGRHLVLCGRSFWKYLEAAEREGNPPVSRAEVLDIGDVAGRDPSSLLIVTTGSQGEPRSALARASEGEHDLLVVGRGDLLLHSARTIPGNEGEVHEMWNRLVARGVKLVTERRLHTSGHAQQEELTELLRMVRPKAFVPIHGETNFLIAHGDLARTLGVPTQVLGNGEALAFAGGKQVKAPFDGAKRSETGAKVLWADGPAIGDEEAMKLRERKKVAWNGLVVVEIAARRAADGTAVADEVQLETRAMWQGEGGELLNAMRATARRAVSGCPAHTPWTEVREAVRASVRAVARKALDKRPEVLVTLHAGRLA